MPDFAHDPTLASLTSHGEFHVRVVDARVNLVSMLEPDAIEVAAVVSVGSVSQGWGAVGGSCAPLTRGTLRMSLGTAARHDAPV